MILVATSQVMLTYYTRPFSNSFESILLCASLCTYADYAHKTSAKLAFLLGALFSLGVFTRITFPLYAFPIGIAFIYQAIKRCVLTNTSIFFLKLIVYGIVEASISISFSVQSYP